ncbi:MAG: sigma-70 family RNA polymerase sigma factor [Firmicutes bacterium]|nr:sigma-70 family RNA polymerase sigma factor [Bacillota bacterium]
MNKIVLHPASIEVEFEELYKKQFSSVYNYIYFHIGDAMDAEDLTADIFVRAYKYWKSYSNSKGSQGEWLGGIARNTLKTYFKIKACKPQVSQLSEFIAADICIEDCYLHKEELLQVLAQIKALPELQRELLSMKYLLRLTNREIAKTTGMSESNVGVVLHRSIKKIQKNSKNTLYKYYE